MGARCKSLDVCRSLCARISKSNFSPAKFPIRAHHSAINNALPGLPGRLMWLVHSELLFGYCCLLRSPNFGPPMRVKPFSYLFESFSNACEFELVGNSGRRIRMEKPTRTGAIRTETTTLRLISLVSHSICHEIHRPDSVVLMA